MSVLRYHGTKALADYLEAAIPELAGRVHVGQEEPAPVAQGAYPQVALLPGRWRFTPFQADEIAEDGAVLAGRTDVLLLDVGSLTGSIELRVFAKSRPERERIEDLIEYEFLKQEDRPGVLVQTLTGVQVGGTATLSEAPIAYLLDESEWREEMAFSDKRFSFIDLDVNLPALVLRTGVYTIDQLVLAITEDMTTETAADIVIESVEVDEDGAVSPA